MLRAAVISLERRSFQQWDPSAVDYETTSSALIASASKGLCEDLDRINDLVAVVRNILTVGEKVQDLCADSGFDKHMLRLVNCCVRVTARGYDGDPGNGDEEKWQLVVNAYKKLLITSLQFMNNFCARNEKRKLLLWRALFDSGHEQLGDSHETEARNHFQWVADCVDNDRVGGKLPEKPFYDRHGGEDAHIPTGGTFSDYPFYGNQPDAVSDGAPKTEDLRPPAMFYYWLVQRKKLDDRCEWDEAEKRVDVRRLWEDRFKNNNDERAAAMGREAYRQEGAAMHHDLLRRQSVKASVAKVLGHNDPLEFIPTRLGDIETRFYEDLRIKTGKRHGVYSESDFPRAKRISVRTTREEAYTIGCSTAAAQDILNSNKAALMKRFTDYNASQQALEDRAGNGEPVEQPELDEEHESEGEDDYHGSTEDGRGLLTDVPLILGPSEIEILPNMIMSGLVMNQEVSSQEEYDLLLDMHHLRSHMLLAQENGQNLLRELLIFVAAWDLREEELYFKFMVKIVSQLLYNGLIPFAYNCFRDSTKQRAKDIISPAQAVIMKLLTNIFKARADSYKAALLDNNPTPDPGLVEVEVVNFLFYEFRTKIVPNTCALIHFQGKVHDNAAPPEDFPLNLWDMERMYEGVYQYLEFFAVLTEEQGWKDIMAEWKVANELVTILKELEDAIPKLNPGPQFAVPTKTTPDGPQEMPQIASKSSDTPRLVTVNGKTMIEGSVPGTGSVAASKAKLDQTLQLTEEYRAKQHKKMEEIKDALAKMKKKKLPPEQKQSADALADELSKLEVDTLKAPLPATDSELQLPYPEEAQDEPADFEWRNLKKLTVLVLSSLTWKNKTVQDQVREFGGLEALIGSCRHDENNPYIREHAIMCLRFAVEGNAENALVIQKMAEKFNRQLQRGPPQQALPQSQPQQQQQLRGGSVTLPPAPLPPSEATPEVPREVLDTQSFETFLDDKGQVGLRRKSPHASPLTAAVVAAPSSKEATKLIKEAAAQAIQNAIAGGVGGEKGAGTAKMTKMAAERAAALMQNVLQELPLPEDMDREGADIFARLNLAAAQSAQLVELERESTGGEQ